MHRLDVAGGAAPSFRRSVSRPVGMGRLRGRHVDIAGRVVVVTGGGRGIGAGIARAFAREGCRVCLCGRSVPHLEAVGRACHELGAMQVLCRKVDVSVEEEVAAFADAVLSEVGTPDAVFNNAAILGPLEPIVSYPAGDFRSVLLVNVLGVFLVTRAFLPGMLARGSGAVINLSSGLGRFATRDCSGYVASKWAVEGFTRAAAAEVRGKGLAVVAVSPGMVATDMLAAYLGAGAADYPTPDEVGPGFVRLYRQLGPERNGESLDLESFL